MQNWCEAHQGGSSSCVLSNEVLCGMRLYIRMSWSDRKRHFQVYWWLCKSSVEQNCEDDWRDYISKVSGPLSHASFLHSFSNFNYVGMDGALSGPSQVNLLLLYNGFKSCQHEKPIVPNGINLLIRKSALDRLQFSFINWFFLDILSVRASCINFDFFHLTFLSCVNTWTVLNKISDPLRKNRLPANILVWKQEKIQRKYE